MKRASRPLGHLMKLGLWLALAAAVLVLAQACDYPAFEFRSKADAGSSAGASGGQGGSGGTGNVAGGGSGNTGAVDGGHGGVGGDPNCELPADSCGPGKKCSVSNEATGETTCVPAGQNAPWTPCLQDADCVAGTWCDHTSKVCKPFCLGTTQCPAGAQCHLALTAEQVIIPIPNGVGVCTAHCNPLNPTSCPVNTNCVYLEQPQEFDCWGTSSNGMTCSGCASSTECAQGLVCMEVATALCRAWCALSGGSCSTGVCTGFVAEINYDGQTLGYCYPC